MIAERNFLHRAGRWHGPASVRRREEHHWAVWVANNWDRPDEGFKEVPDPALATRFGGNGTVVFFGLAKPVRTPLIGPPTTP